MEKIFTTLGLNNDLLFCTFQYYFNFFLFLLYLIAVFVFDNPWIVLHFVYGIVPLLDYYIPVDTRNPTSDESKKLRKLISFKIPLYMTLILDWIILISGLYYITHNQLYLFNKIGMVMAIALLITNSFNVSHEIFHKPSKIEQFIGALHLSKNLQTHFIVEHLQGHHKHVATPIDPASAKLNENFYSFLIRSFVGAFFSAWRVENQRCIQLYKTKYTLYNRMFYCSLNDLLLPIFVGLVFSFEIMFYFTLIALISTANLACINYIEHYGLSRKEVSPGVYEEVNITHSWNAPHRISNYFLFKLQRHSDHHVNPLKPYQILCSFEDSPTLPQGYAACLFLAFFPNFWFYVINPLCEIYNKGEKPDEKVLKSTNEKIIKILFNANYILFGLTITQFFVKYCL